MSSHKHSFASNPLLILANTALGEHWAPNDDMVENRIIVNSNANANNTSTENTASENSGKMIMSKTPHSNYATVESKQGHQQNSSILAVADSEEYEANGIANQQHQAMALSAFGITVDSTVEQTPVKRTQLDKPQIVAGSTLASYGLQPNDDHLISSLEAHGADKPETSDQLNLRNKRRRLRKDFRQQLQHRSQRDFFGVFAQYPELTMELAKHLDTSSLLLLYSVSKDFHATVNGHMSHVMKTCAAYQCPESSRVFVFKLYQPLCMPDPVGRPQQLNTEFIRDVPSLRWLAMISHREKVVRDILASMAREGHRMPKTMSLTLKKMWLTMDISTSSRRAQLMHNERYWTDNDIYNVQLFLMKLDMRFNDPIDGPGDDGLKKLFLGQRGLTPLRDLLKRTRFTSILEIIQLAVRYAGVEGPGSQNREMSLFGVPPEEVGIGHLEGWGKGKVHLYRMDELVLREAVRRHLELDKHMMDMMLWGYVDPITKENIEPSLEEMYMSDDEKDTLQLDPKGKSKAKMEDDENAEIRDANQGWESSEDEDMS